ncbi:hypothetical protein ACLBWX_22490 [Methylobacterium sp. M6A4_1b]
MIVLLACFPKSGSSSLSNLIAAQPNFTRAEFTPYYGRREQELERGLITNFVGKNCVAQHHVRGSEYTQNLIGEFDMKLIVLVRRLGDAIASLNDHIVNEHEATPVGYFEEHFKQMASAERLEAVADLAAPWYVNFYVSWYRSKPECIVRYEDVILKNDLRKVESILQRKIVTEEKNVAPTRFNVGIEGRGDAIKDRISRLFKYYPDVDFSPII